MSMQMTVADRRRAAGFTLIEVLAALVIVALGMLGVIEAVTQSARNGTYMREKTLAHWIAMNVITERRLQATAPEVGETSDDVDFAGERWHWTMRVTQTQVESLVRMDVSVRAADAAQNTSLTTVTGFYGRAIGAAGGSSLPWGGPQGTGGKQEPDGESTGAPQQPPAQPAPQPQPQPTDDEE